MNPVREVEAAAELNESATAQAIWQELVEMESRHLTGIQALLGTVELADGEAEAGFLARDGAAREVRPLEQRLGVVLTVLEVPVVAAPGNPELLRQPIDPEDAASLLVEG